MGRESLQCVVFPGVCVENNREDEGEINSGIPSEKDFGQNV
ncbi:hypothetical protein COLO4_38209 [Corchorus olitorius]|uniref:Uncharacterized protein n=1 Tax=Corchorus olitorius TaxID=93759 RepID=A0A1R3FWE5_9ROSI|nr:hypothetical protein COLO4_38209 [Corchorus olitorius]